MFTRRAPLQKRPRSKGRALGRFEQGSVLTEFVLVAPVMLLIAGSALRFYQELQAQEIGITFSREIATLAYNRCVDKTITKLQRNGATNQDSLVIDTDETKKQITECLAQVAAQFLASWSQTNPLAATTTPEITLEVHRCSLTELVPTTCNSPTIIKVGTAPSGAPTLTLFRNRLTFARIDFTMTPRSTFIAAIQPRPVFYEATV